MSIFDSIEKFAASDHGAVLLPVVEQKALTSAEALVGGFIASAVADAPDATEADLVETVDGDVWHFVRSKLGFLGFMVDIARNTPSVDGKVRAMIAAALAALAVQEKPVPLAQGGGPPA